MKVCKACKKEVPDDTSGACPKCKSTEGYTISITLTLSHKIEAGISKYNKQIERLEKFQEIYKGTKVEENLEVKIENLKKVIKDLEKISLIKPGTKVVSDKVGLSENTVVVKNSETKTKTFTVDTILVKAVSKIKEGDEEVERSNDAIFEELRLIRQGNTKLLENTKPKSKSRHFVEYLLVFLLGAVASYVGTYFYTLGNVSS